MSLDVLENRIDNLEDDMKELRTQSGINREKIHSLEVSYAKVIAWGAGAVFSATGLVQLIQLLVK